MYAYSCRQGIGKMLTCVQTSGTQTVSQLIREPSRRLMSDSSTRSVWTTWSLDMSDSFRARFMMLVAHTSGIQYLDMGLLSSIISTIFFSLSNMIPAPSCDRVGYARPTRANRSDETSRKVNMNGMVVGYGEKERLWLCGSNAAIKPPFSDTSL